MACNLDTPFSITASVNGSIAEVTVTGEIDPSTVGTFTTVLHTLVSDGVDHFVIDASGLTFVDSTAIHALQRLVNEGSHRDPERHDAPAARSPPRDRAGHA